MFSITLLLFLAAIALFFFVFTPAANQGFFTTNRIITGGVATGLLLPLMIFFLVRLLTSDSRHAKSLAERRKKLDEFLQRVNVMIAPRGLRWKISPFGSWIVLSLGFKKGVDAKQVKGILSKRAKENAVNSEFKQKVSGRGFNEEPNKSRVLRERDINLDIIENKDSSRRHSINNKGDKPPTFQNTLKNSSTSRASREFESKNSLEFYNKNDKLSSNLKFEDKREIDKKYEKKKSLGELGLFNKDPYGSESESQSSSEARPNKDFKNRNLMKESYYKEEDDDENSSEYRISKSRKKRKRNSPSDSKYEAELPEVLVVNKSSKKKPILKQYESRRQVMPWDDIDSENDFDKANGGRRSQERSSVKIKSQPSYEMLEIRDPGKQRNKRMGRFLLDEVNKEMRQTHDFNVYGEKFSPNEASRSYLKSGRKRDSSNRKRRGMPW